MCFLALYPFGSYLPSSLFSYRYPKCIQQGLPPYLLKRLGIKRIWNSRRPCLCYSFSVSSVSWFNTPQPSALFEFRSIATYSKTSIMLAELEIFLMRSVFSYLLSCHTELDCVLFSEWRREPLCNFRPSDSNKTICFLGLCIWPEL